MVGRKEDTGKGPRIWGLPEREKRGNSRGLLGIQGKMRWICKWWGPFCEMGPRLRDSTGKTDPLVFLGRDCSGEGRRESRKK